VRSRGLTPFVYLPLRFFAAGALRAGARFAADAGFRALCAAGARFAEEELDGAVARRAAVRGVVDRRPVSRSVAIALSSISLVRLFGCFVFFAAVARAIDVLLLLFGRVQSIHRSIACVPGAGNRCMTHANAARDRAVGRHLPDENGSATAASRCRLPPRPTVPRPAHALPSCARAAPSPPAYAPPRQTR
jgi:hypothetical protein